MKDFLNDLDKKKRGVYFNEQNKDWRIGRKMAGPNPECPNCYTHMPQLKEQYNIGQREWERL